MKKIQPGDPESISQDNVAQNLEQIQELFPEAWASGKLDFDVLKQLLGASVDDRDEKYGLNWHGKRKARRLAMTPSLGTLRPFPGESLNWNKTRNLMIEGDNLEVLKLLQKSYTGRVKIIYIDPPYNTGNDFVYPDDFSDSIKNYQILTQQIDADGRRLTSSAESSGRFHTDWLNMIFPRLRIARDFLSPDGVIFVSIDEKEVARLRMVLDEIFGEENFVSNLIWRSRTSISDDQEVSLNHNHTLIYAKNRESLEYHGEPLDESEYDNPDGDSRGPWKLVPLDANKPGGNTNYPILNPKTGVEYWPPTGRSWAINPNEYQKLFDDKRIKFGKSDDAAPKKKLFLKERLTAGETRTPSSILLDAGTTKDGTEECAELMESKKVFDYPKPTTLISRLIQYGSSANNPTIVMDFFAGSGTTGHASWLRSSCDGRDRQFILVQLPEPIDSNELRQRAAADFCKSQKLPPNIAELTKERLRRAARKLAATSADRNLDLGFRVFKLDSSCINTWNPEQDEFEQTLLTSIEHIKSDRGEDDILYELLLKLGLDLCVPIEKQVISNKDVYSIGEGVLFVCLAAKVSRDDAERLAIGMIQWWKELNPASESTVVFRDSAFIDDVTKTNVTAILQQHGLGNVRSL